MSSSASSKAGVLLALAGAGVAAGIVAAGRSNAGAAQPKPTAPTSGGAPVGSGGGGGVTVPGLPKPKPTPAPTPKPTPGTSIVPEPFWSPDPATVNLTQSQQVVKLQAFLKRVQPYWIPRPAECGRFAAALVMAADLERYPLDLLVGHAWAEGALKPYMVPTKGSGAYGPVQVTAITCKDVGMSYPPADVLTACRVGIRYMRKMRAYGAPNLNGALRMYGLGPGGYRDFVREGCSGQPCSRPQSVWRHECGCSGDSNRYTYKVANMAKKAAAAGLHTRRWSDWQGA